MKILCITTEPDAHLGFVQRHLDEEILVFDPYKLPFNTDITYKWEKGEFQVFSESRHLNICDAVWYRKPRLLKESEMPVDPMYTEYAYSAYTKTVQSLYVLLRDKFWVSNYWSIIRASNKLFQAEVAYELGLNVPRSLLTTSASVAGSFLHENRDCIAKMIGTHHVFDGTNSYVFYATKVEPDIDLSGLAVAPAIFQLRVNKIFDIRVTVVGNQVFPCEIHQIGEIQGKVDWREGVLYPNEEEVLVYKHHKDFPSKIGEACIQMLKMMDLQYGAFDFVVDVDGRYWFLEVNPNGQWAFIEETSGLPISTAFVEAFSGSNRI